MKKRTVALLMAAVLLFGAAVGGTFAYLTAQTDSLVNTFTAGNVQITLEETGAVDNAKSFKMIPGEDLAKDPTLTVLAGSEDCYLFVEVTASADAADYISYAMADGWTNLSGNVWYRPLVSASAEDQEFAVLKGNKVTVLDGVTSTMMEAVTAGTKTVTLTVKGYAVQSEGFESAADAWADTFGA